MHTVAPCMLTSTVPVVAIGVADGACATDNDGDVDVDITPAGGDDIVG